MGTKEKVQEGGRNIIGVSYIHTNVSIDRDYEVMKTGTERSSDRHCQTSFQIFLAISERKIRN